MPDLMAVHSSLPGFCHYCNDFQMPVPIPMLCPFFPKSYALFKYYTYSSKTCCCHRQGDAQLRMFQNVHSFSEQHEIKERDPDWNWKNRILMSALPQATCMSLGKLLHVYRSHFLTCKARVSVLMASEDPSSFKSLLSQIYVSFCQLSFKTTAQKQSFQK